MIDFHTQLIDGIAIVSVSGNLDSTSHDYFFENIADLMKNNIAEIIIDCDDLGFISSRSLGKLIVARNRAAKFNGKIYLTHVNATIANLLQITKLNTLVGVHLSTDELLVQLQAQQAKRARKAHRTQVLLPRIHEPGMPSSARDNFQPVIEPGTVEPATAALESRQTLRVRPR